MISYVLINCVPGSEKKIISELKEISQIVEVNGIMGRYDIFAKVSTNVPHKMDTIIMKIRDIAGITASYSLPVLYGQGGTILEEEKRK